MSPRFPRHEDGAVAILVAISALLIFGLCALSVDMGNAYARKRDLQTQADLAALAGAAELPATTSSEESAVEAAVDAYARENLVTGQIPSDWDFTDDIHDNGFVEFEGPNKIRVWTPPADVNFGAAAALGKSKTRVVAHAAAAIRSPGLGGVPFFAVSGCDYGLQTLSQDPHDLAPTSGWTAPETVECPAGSTAGNFGTIELPRKSTDDSGKWIQLNTAEGPDPAISLAPYPGWTPTDAPECDKNDAAPTIASPDKNNMHFDTNCVFTKTGFPGSDVTAGLIAGVGPLTGTGAHDGRLKEPTSATPASTDASSAGCAPDGTKSQWDSGIRERGKGSNPLVLVNNDILSCFFLNDTTTVGDIARPDLTFPSSAKHTLSPEIFKSPRFLWVPVFAVQPASGSGWYKVVGWRPAFITDQPPTATRANRQVGSSTINGIKLTSNAKEILGMKVVFFNGQALPDSMAAKGPTFDYTGTGTRVVALVE